MGLEGQTLANIIIFAVVAFIVLIAIINRNPSPNRYSLVTQTGSRGPSTWQEAEHFAAQYMRNLGCVDAQVTRQSKDGGIDVMSSGYVAQVKHYRGSVGAPAIQALFGVARSQNKQALFFTSGTYTREAQQFASRHVALFVYRADGSVQSANGYATHLVNVGLR